MDLVKEDLGRVGVVNGLNLVGWNLLASGWKICVKVNVPVRNAGGGGGYEFGKRRSCEAKVRA